MATVAPNQITRESSPPHRDACGENEVGQEECSYEDTG